VTKKHFLIAIALILACVLVSPTFSVKAATTYKGEFMSFSYDEAGKPNAITIVDSNNRRVKHALSNSVLYYLNGQSTNEKTFKKGMEVALEKTGNTVTKLQGIQDIAMDSPSSVNYQVTGTVTKIDPNGLFITIKPDYGSETQYYINRDTRFFKNNTVADLSMLYEGDKVKLKLPDGTVSTIYEVEMINSGVLVENIYKATLKSANAYNNSVTVSNAQPFENWMFGSNVTSDLSSFTFTNETTIYAGNAKITKNELRNYTDKEFYFATIHQFGKEIIKKIVILQENERTYYDNFSAVNTNYNLLSLAKIGNVYYHDGSILIRNGRLVEPTTLTAFGAAFLVTDGATRSNFAHVVNVTNDGFTAPNLANHELYFGELSFVDTDNYLLEINDAVKLEQNYWKAVDDEVVLAFSNGTAANANYNSQVIKLIPNMDLFEYETYYGYFYVKNGHIQALQILDPSQEKTSRVLTGSVSAIQSTNPAFISIRNVSQWLNGGWNEGLAMQNVNLAQALIIKDGKAISGAQIKTSNRVVLLSTNGLDVHVVLVNE
jgi:hypothetical protein